MKKLTAQSLRKKYSKLITCGLEIDSGWYPLLNTLCGLLQWDIDRNGYPQITTNQIKSKYGGLRFYYSWAGIPSKDENKCGIQEGMIRFAEYLSEEICEDCGTNRGVSQTKIDWIRTLCRECEEKCAIK